MNNNYSHFSLRLAAACLPVLCFAATPGSVNVNFGKLPLSFEPNRGQTDARVDFLSRGKGYTLFLTRGQAVLRLEKDALRMKLLGAAEAPIASAADPLPDVANYFQGRDPSQWHTAVPTYQKVKYTGVYPGVDLVYYGLTRGRLEHDFIVAPGADPSQIALAFEGAISHHQPPRRSVPETGRNRIALSKTGRLSDGARRQATCGRALRARPKQCALRVGRL